MIYIYIYAKYCLLLWKIKNINIFDEQKSANISYFSAPLLEAFYFCCALFSSDAHFWSKFKNKHIQIVSKKNNLANYTTTSTTTALISLIVYHYQKRIQCSPTLILCVACNKFLVNKCTQYSKYRRIILDIINIFSLTKKQSTYAFHMICKYLHNLRATLQSNYMKERKKSYKLYIFFVAKQKQRQKHFILLIKHSLCV